MSREHIHFVTGRLAAPALEELLAQLAPEAGFDYSVDVLPISVAALMPAAWMATRVRPPQRASRVIVPGHCRGDLQNVVDRLRLPVQRGPVDLRELPAYFGQRGTMAESYGNYDIEILAEINHAPRLSRAELLERAEAYRRDGADVIDLGCEPGDTWRGVADAVRALRDAGHRVSIDSMNPDEIGPAVRAGAELVLSVNRTNRHAAVDWGCEVVVIPDSQEHENSLPNESLLETVEWLDARRVPWRADPVLEPIGFGFARSLQRYLDLRDRLPDAEMMMGVGNLTELTDADSAAINVLLLGFCQELRIRSILTTEVIHWAANSVRECDLARRLVYHAVQHATLPKHLEPDLHLLRDADLLRYPPEMFQRMAREIKDPNYRIFAQDGLLHVVTAGAYWRGEDPFQLFEHMMAAREKPLDAKHAFYLGYEMAKAAVARTLGKNYQQDEELAWGLLTPDEGGGDREAHR